jgi:hypothetical protein
MTTSKYQLVSKMADDAEIITQKQHCIEDGTVKGKILFVIIFNLHWFSMYGG